MTATRNRAGLPSPFLIPTPRVDCSPATTRCGDCSLVPLRPTAKNSVTAGAGNIASARPEAANPNTTKRVRIGNGTDARNGRLVEGPGLDATVIGRAVVLLRRHSAITDSAIVVPAIPTTMDVLRKPQGDQEMTIDKTTTRARDSPNASARRSGMSKSRSGNRATLKA